MNRREPLSWVAGTLMASPAIAFALFYGLVASRFREQPDPGSWLVEHVEPWMTLMLYSWIAALCGFVIAATLAFGVWQHRRTP